MRRQELIPSSDKSLELSSFPEVAASQRRTTRDWNPGSLFKFLLRTPRDRTDHPQPASRSCQGHLGGGHCKPSLVKRQAATLWLAERQGGFRC